MLLGNRQPTPRNYAAAVRGLYGEAAGDVLRLYPGATAAQVRQSATDLASDRFIVYSAWKWADDQRAAGAPLYRYLYAHPRPSMTPEMAGALSGLAGGIIEQSVAALQGDRESLIAWLGPAIGPDSFEVGSDVYDAFVQHDAQAAQAFKSSNGRGKKWLADIFLLAR